MKMLINISLPVEPFNTMARNGTAGEKIGLIVKDIKPDFIYFSDMDGNRGAVMLVDVPSASSIPSIAEPWYLIFEATCEFKIAMSADDLMNADLLNLDKKWRE